MDTDEQIQETYSRLFQVDAKLWKDLRRLPVEDVVRRTEVSFDEPTGSYRIPFLDRTYMVDPAGESVSYDGKAFRRDEAFQVQMVLVTYLACATEAVPTDAIVTAKQLPGGETFFQGPHKLRTGPLLRRYGNDAQAFQELGARFGGIRNEFGDASFTFRPLPKTPLGFILYEADDEFPARMVVTFDPSIATHFQLDAVWALVNITVDRLLT